jgi:hypothetical protein
MQTGSLILQSYLKTKDLDKLLYEEKVQKLRDEKAQKLIDKKVQELLDENKGTDFLFPDFLIPLNFYLHVLENIHEAMLPFMNEERKKQLLRDLQATYLLLLTQKKYEITHQKSENVTTYESHLEKCERLIDLLNYQLACKEQNIEPSPHYGCGNKEKSVAYLGLFYGQWFAQKMVAATERKTKTIKENMSWVNEKRLYWVWASGLIKTMLELLPPDFFNNDQAKQSARTPDPYTGCMSWGLYYFRFGLNLSLLLKHTIRGPWMSVEEKSTPWTERFKTQWAQRKFTLLNDSIWATGNLVCFFWLCGKGVAGTWGDMLTIGLLVFDIALAVWDFEEQQTRYNKEMLNYKTSISRLKKQIKDASNSQSDMSNQIAEYKRQLSALERAQDKCYREWRYQKINLATNVSYAIGLMLAFVLLTAPFFPFAAGALLALSVTGAVLCFAFSVISNAVKGGIELHKTKATAKEIQKDHAQKLSEFQTLIQKNPDLNDDAKKFLFLELKQLTAETEYQKNMISFQTMHLIRSILFEALIPALVFVSFVFLPLGIGLAAIGAVIGLAIASNLIINATFKPKKDDLKPFNQDEYNLFCKASTERSFNAHSFFKKPAISSAPTSKQDDYEMQPLLGNNSCSGV